LKKQGLTNWARNGISFVSPPYIDYCSPPILIFRVGFFFTAPLIEITSGRILTLRLPAPIRDGPGTSLKRNRSRSTIIERYFDVRGKAILAALDQVSAKYGTTPTMVSPAWLLAKSLVTTPIVSARTPEQLKLLRDAPALKPDTEDLEVLDRASALEEAAA